MAEESIFNNWDNVVAPVRNDIVFEERNKAYGAYALRKNHNRTVALALLITGTSFLFVVCLPTIIDWLNNKMEEVEVPVDMTVVDLTAPPPLDETEPPPPPPPPPPVMETVKFTPPVVTDEEVVDEPPPIQIEETPQISTVTQEGTEDAIVIPEEKSAVVEPVSDEIFTIVEIQAEFPGGYGELAKFLEKNFVYPQMEREAGISGTCYVTFVVERDGSITGVEIQRGVSGGPACNKEALRLVKLMPKWNVARQQGRTVRSRFSLPIKFTLK